MFDRHDEPHPREPEQEQMLAAYQEVLLDLLSLGLPPEEVQRCLLADPRFALLGTYVVAMEPRAIEVATELTHTWSRATR